MARYAWRTSDCSAGLPLPSLLSLLLGLPALLLLSLLLLLLPVLLLGCSSEDELAGRVVGSSPPACGNHWLLLLVLALHGPSVLIPGDLMRAGRGRPGACGCNRAAGACRRNGMVVLASMQRPVLVPSCSGKQGCRSSWRSSRCRVARIVAS